MCPRTQSDRQTSRARSPPYQPIRSALTRNSRAVVETYRVTGSPRSMLAWPVKPSLACGAPTCLIHQCGSPGSEFSAVVVFILFWVLCRGGCVPADAVQPDIAPAIAPPATALAVMAPAACAVLPRNARLVGGIVESLAGSTAESMIGSVA